MSVARRIKRAAKGNFGDYKDLKDGLFEMRLRDGPGYRIYYTKMGNAVYLLLVAGDKSSQEKDIERAKVMISILKA